MTKILITGVNGFVGKHLAHELSEHDIQVVGIGGPQGNRDRQPEFVNEYQMVDLMDAEATMAINFDGVDGVIHLAGLAAAGPSFDNPRQYMETNVGLETNLFEAARAQDKHPKFIIVSSGTLYDPKSGLPITEASPVLPSSPYAVSKLGQEQMAEYYTTRGFEIVIARPFNHIGPGQGPGFIVPDLAQQVIAYERGEATQVLVGNLDAKRDYTDVRDIATAYRLLFEKGRSGEIYNICSGVSRSGHDILSLILSASGVNAPIVEDSARMRPSDVPDHYGLHDKITQDTGWAPRIDISITIQDAVADLRSR